MNELDSLGSNAFAQLPPAVQVWAKAQAADLVALGQFGTVQQQHLTLKIGGMFPQADQGRILSSIRYVALKTSAGGSLDQLYNNRGGLTQFQQQLIAGVQLRR